MLIALRRYFITGLLVWVPLIVTLVVIRFLVDLLDVTILLLPPTWRPEAFLGFNVPGSGVLFAVMVVFLTGLVAANIVGKKLVELGESILERIPLVSSIYSAVKQLLKTILHDGGQSFRRVVMVEYPRRGLWTLGFQTNVGIGELRPSPDGELITVFIPTTPNPTSGFVIIVPREDAIFLNLSIEEGLKFVMSLGVVAPAWSVQQAEEPSTVARDTSKT